MPRPDPTRPDPSTELPQTLHERVGRQDATAQALAEEPLDLPERISIATAAQRLKAQYAREGRPPPTL